MIKIDGENVHLEGKGNDIMLEYMNLTEIIYKDVLKADKDAEARDLFEKGLAFAIKSDEEKDKELLKMKNKSILLENILNKLEDLEEGEEND